MISRLLLLGLLCAGPVPALAAQDSIPVLPPIAVTVARIPAEAGLLGLPLTSVAGEVARRSRPFAALDELLAFLPGVFATDRGDATVDQRLAVRGTGARANFGIRGIRVLVDGIPATLPDGQTQLGPLIAQAITRIDLARGPMGALHGNGAGGVVAFETASGLDTPGQARVAAQGGTWGSRQALVGLMGGSPHLGATLYATANASNGARTHAASSQRRVQGGVTWQASPGNQLLLRFGWQDDPFSESPGALTPVAFAADPTAAAGRSVALDAGKTVQQRQIALGWDHAGTRLSVESRAWLLGRDLENPIAAPAAGAPTSGTWISLTRAVRGARTSLTWRPTPTVELTAGLDAQRMRDDRTNRPHGGAGPEGAAFVDQRETVTEHGGLVQSLWRISPTLGLRTGVRHDRVRFTVDDHLDPTASGTRLLGATSGSASLGWMRDRTSAWVGVAQAFETPTTTELTNRADGSTGLNRDLDPARTTSVELGVRHAAGRLQLEAAAWRATTRDAILPAADIEGRSIFRNVDRTRALGLELATAVLVTRGVLLRASGTVLDARFGPTVRDADGIGIGDRRIPGIPAATLRLGATARRDDWSFDIDHGFRSGTEAYDAGGGRAAGWGIGITNAAVRWSPRTDLSLYLLGGNLANRAVVGAVVVNAAGSRFIQPLSGRSIAIGVELALD